MDVQAYSVIFVSGEMIGIGFGIF